MNDLIHTVNALRNVAPSDLRFAVKRVLVILSSPRSGSSLLKNTLTAHPDIASMDGEIEPFLILTRNGFGHTSDSDAIGELSNMDELADNIFDDLTVPAEDLPPPVQLKQRWVRRLLLQFPALFANGPGHRNLLQALEEALDETGEEVKVSRIRREHELQNLILAKIYKAARWRINYYDGIPTSEASSCFDEPFKIEEPPFVAPRLYRRKFTEADVENKTLLFKTPPDAYRIGMYEQLFPNADVKYLHLTRGYAQCVNGLIDGWLSPVGFFSHDMRGAGLRLNINGYSESVKFGKWWWKFDLPPNWREFTSANLQDVCLNQWMSTHQSILASGVPALRMSFENFLADPVTTVKKIVTHFGFSDMCLPPSLPIMMATEAPKRQRWKKREHQLLALGERKDVRTMMKSLGYTMSPDTWL